MPATEDDVSSSIALASEANFRIGGLIVRPALREVEFDGRAETLEPRVMQVLIALTQAKGAVVSRDDLLRRCWSGRIVGDNAIHRAVGRVRELGTSFANGAFVVETVPKVGYRLTSAAQAAFDLLPAALAPAADIVAAREDAAPRTVDRRLLLAALGAAGAAAAGGVLLLRPDREAQRVEALMAQTENALRLDMPDSAMQGAGFLEEAVGLRPSNAEAWGRLAFVRYVMAEYAPPDLVETSVSGAQEAARRALSLRRRQPDALAALALLPPMFGDWHAADRRVQSVLDVAPKHLDTLDARDFYRVGVGRGVESARSRLSYVDNEPLHAGHQYKAAYAHWILGQIGDADRTSDRAMSLWPKHLGVWFGRLWTLAFTGRPERALLHIDDKASRPDLPDWLFALLRATMQAMISRTGPDTAAAVKLIINSVEWSPSNAINGVLQLCGLGEIDRAFDVAEAYLLERGPLIASVRWREGQTSVNEQRRRKTNMLFVPVSAPMRDDPRFAALTRDVGLDAYWEAAGVRPDHLR